MRSIIKKKTLNFSFFTRFNHKKKLTETEKNIMIGLKKIE